MAKKFLMPIDMTQLEVLNMRLQQLGSDPGAPVTGQLWYHTGRNRPVWRDGGANNDIYPSASTNTINTNVLRDGSGNFAAGTITANLTGVASNATQLNGQADTFYLARTNHTGTQLASTISNFDTQVRTSRLDQMAAPTATVSFNSQLISGVLDPVSPQDVATKAYVDATSSGLAVKSSVRVATNVALPAYSRTGNVITASANGVLAAVDGITLVVANRVLVKNGAAGADNGIYVVTSVGSAGAPFVLTRSTDADISAEVPSGMFCFVEEGTVNDNTGWVLTTNNPITLNTTALAFTQFSSAGSYTSGNGITITGQVIAATLTARLTFTSLAIDLANIGTAGTFTQVTTDQYGRVTAGADMVTGTGLVTKTAAGTFTSRVMTGTAARITVTNGDGVAGNPTFDIAATYVGQASITTLGTVTTGVWNGTVIAPAFGGTGLNTSTATNGQILIGNGTGLTLASLTAGSGIVITPGAGSITIAATGGGTVAKFAVSIGNGALTSFTVTHSLGSKDVLVAIYDNATNEEVQADVVHTSTTVVTLVFAVAPTTNQFRVVVLG